MRVREKKTGKTYEVFPASRPEGIRFVRADNPKIAYAWEELEAATEAKAEVSTTSHVGIRVPIMSSGTVLPTPGTSRKPQVVMQQNKAIPARRPK
jgi:hypothetical protein